MDKRKVKRFIGKSVAGFAVGFSCGFCNTQYRVKA